ncbi:MAG: alpha/beta hydrolase [Parafilimonas sp.]
MGGGVKAQPYNNPPTSPSDSTPANCNWDLRSQIFNTVYALDGTHMTSVIVYGNGTNTNYHDVAFQYEDKKDQCINSDGCSGISDDYADTLKIFVYYPKHDYSTATGSKLPVFIFAHAGGFSDCKRLTPVGESQELCTDMAHRGFVVFSIEYRTGRKIDENPGTYAPYTSVFQLAAAYRASQDVRGAIRYIVYRQNHEGTGDINDPYRIDLNNIFLGGASAGSVAMLSASYFYETSGQAMLNDVFPVQGDVITHVMGDINIDFYLGNDNINYMPGVKGILNCWGSLNVPLSYFPKGGIPHPIDFFKNLPYKPPVISFCGRQDNVFNYNYQPVYYSPAMGAHSFFNSTSNCLINPPYTLEGLDNSTPDMYNLGSGGFFNLVLQPLGIFLEFYMDCQMHHGLDDDDNTCGKCISQPTNYFLRSDCVTPCAYTSNFGVPSANSQLLTYIYIASRAATFFQAIMSLTTSNVTKTSFIECENYRNSCGTDSYNTTNCLSGCSGN